MKNVCVAIMLALLLLVPAVGSVAQDATVNVEAEFKWQAGTEPDLQYYQLYVGDTQDFEAMEPFGEQIPFNPNDPDAPTTIEHGTPLTVAAGAVTTKHFALTAIDTSGNESQPSTSVAVVIDKEPPSIPIELKVTVKVVVEDANVTQQ